MNKDERYKAGLAQMKFYYSNQYLDWRYVEVLTISKIISDFDIVYVEFKSDKEMIINGWYYEAMSQTIQSIEDLFSMMLYSKNIEWFAKEVIHYNASDIKKKIEKYNCENIDHILEDFRIPYLDFSIEWPQQDICDFVKKSLNFIKDNMSNIVIFYKKYYEDYCQYKHGMSVALSKFGNKTWESIGGTGSLMSFFRDGINNKFFNAKSKEGLGLYLVPETQKHLKELSEEDNLLTFKIKAINMEEMLQITKTNCTLMKMLWANILYKSENEKDDKFCLIDPDTFLLQEIS